MNSEYSPVLLYFFGAFSLVFALLSTWYVADVWQKESRTRDWKSISGRIVESRLYRASGPDVTTQQKLDLRYCYIVDRHEHCSGRVRWGAPDLNPNELQRRFPQGATVDVYYNPDAPDESVLRPGVSRQSKVFGPLMVALLLLCSVILFWKAHSGRRSNRPR